MTCRFVLASAGLIVTLVTTGATSLLSPLSEVVARDETVRRVVARGHTHTDVRSNLGLGASSQPAADRTAAASHEARAVAFLAREVPQWKASNDCYSCHNNGDAARALIVASSRGHVVGSSVDDTLAWLRQPSRWNFNKTQGGIDDKPLARLQFAAALRLAVDAGRASGEALAEAAAIVAADQAADGSWRLDTSQSLGSPVTYGTTLATATARRTLAAAGRPDLAAAIEKADTWLRAAKVDSVLDAAAVVLGLANAGDDRGNAQRTRALTTIARGQAPSGGWGPYVNVGPEVFDTALVLLALQGLRATSASAAPAFSDEELANAIARGRAFLIEEQMADGSWPETTRPSHQESYAQRISTTGWALLALMETRGLPPL
jgi:hypothetical protein